MAGSLIESMAGDFHPDEFTDSYREALQQVIEAKIAGKEVVAPAEPETEPGEVIDLMAALKASVERAKAARKDEAPPVKAAAKKATKKAATKKAA